MTDDFPDIPDADAFHGSTPTPPRGARTERESLDSIATSLRVFLWLTVLSIACGVVAFIYLASQSA